MTYILVKLRSISKKARRVTKRIVLEDGRDAGIKTKCVPMVCGMMIV